MADIFRISREELLALEKQWLKKLVAEARACPHVRLPDPALSAPSEDAR